MAHLLPVTRKSCKRLFEPTRSANLAGFSSFSNLSPSIWHCDAVRVCDVLNILDVGRELPTQTGDVGLPACCGCAKVLLHGLKYLELTFESPGKRHSTVLVCQKHPKAIYHVYGSGKNHPKTTLDDSWVTWHVSLQVCDLSEAGQRLDDKSGRPHSPLHLNGTEIDGLTFLLLVLQECQK